MQNQKHQQSCRLSIKDLPSKVNVHGEVVVMSYLQLSEMSTNVLLELCIRFLNQLTRPPFIKLSIVSSMI